MPIGRDGASLIEVVVASVLLAIGILVWLGVFNRSVRRLDEAHLGLHAAILLREASRADAPAGMTRPAGPGRLVVHEEAGSVAVWYEPPGEAVEGNPGTFSREWRWSLAP